MPERASGKKPIRFVTDRRLDFNHATPLKRSYFIASSYRSGSQYLCWQLWKTGALGAPCEYLNPTYELRILKQRFGVVSDSEYIGELLARRTSRNGVFGMKAHFNHFDAFVKDYPALLEVLAPVSYIFISRADKVAQAVSMAKALQTGWWTSRMEKGPPPPLRYDREMIAKCLDEVEGQDSNWHRWFEAHKVAPFPVVYDELTADTERVVGRIVRLLGVENDVPEAVDVPPAKKQGDETNEEWIERFERETGLSGEHRAAGAMPQDDADPGAAAQPAAAGRHFCDRYAHLVKARPEGAGSANGLIAATRLRHRYDAIVAANRDLLHGARVLDIMSSQGFWSMAALDAGAARVTGVEPSRSDVEVARNSFVESAVNPESYQFVRSGIVAALETFEPGVFDVILCKGFFERSPFVEFFRHLSRLRPKHVILDTSVVSGARRMARFAIPKPPDSGIVAIPNHQLIAFLSEFDFSWRLVDWHALGLVDWTGVHDYQNNRRRTYVLDRRA